jgi:hypothetical protein
MQLPHNAVEPLRELHRISGRTCCETCSFPEAINKAKCACSELLRIQMQGMTVILTPIAAVRAGTYIKRLSLARLAAESHRLRCKINKLAQDPLYL